MRDSEVIKLAEAIRDGRCLLFLGPDLATVESENGEQRTINDLIADRLRDMMERPDLVTEQDGLTHVSQVFVSTETIHDRSDVIKLVHDVVRSSGNTPPPLLKQLASLPFTVCFSTSFDNQLFHAFKAQEPAKSPITQAFNFKRKGQKTPMLSTRPEEPLIYSLYGSVEQDSTLAVTEDDLIDFHAAVIKEWLPSNIQKLLKEDMVWLFLGFGLHRWPMKILFRMLREVKPDSSLAFAYESAVLLDRVKSDGERKERLERARVFFRYRQRLILDDAAAHEIVPKLVKQFSKLPPTSKSLVDWKGSPPRVFISYSSEDGEHRDLVSARLEEAGIEVWKDVDNLRVGDEWKTELKTQLRNVDYLILLLSTQTEDPDFNKKVKLNSYWRWELDHFIREQSLTSKEIQNKKILPLRVEECTLPNKVGDGYHVIDFYENGSYAELLREMKKSWQLIQR